MIHKRKSLVDQTLMIQCLLTASFSRAIRTKTGAILVKDGAIVSTGFNGTPRGTDNTMEYYDEATGQLKTNDWVIHGEHNAILNLVRTNSAATIAGSTLYTLYSPCFNCASLIKHMGIVRVVYLYKYRVSESLQWLVSNGVAVEECKMTYPHLKQICDIMTKQNEDDLRIWNKHIKDLQSK